MARDAAPQSAAPSEPVTGALSRAEQTAASYARLGLPREAVPRHVAIIMDGNGRWARRQGKPRVWGHQHGARIVRAIVEEAARLEMTALTLYSFSSENWVRPKEEVGFLMDLYVEYLVAERRTMMDNNVRFRQLGRRDGLNPRILDELDRCQAETAGNDGVTLALALNYGSRTEITDAVRSIARKVQAGELAPDDIAESTIADHLYTAGLPDPDLLIRTAGEMRISNYLLWQISYAEFYVADVCWPDFTLPEFDKAIHAYARRQRKFGDILEESPENPGPRKV